MTLLYNVISSSWLSSNWKYIIYKVFSWQFSCLAQDQIWAQRLCIGVWFLICIRSPCLYLCYWLEARIGEPNVPNPRCRIQRIYFCLLHQTKSSRIRLINQNPHPNLDVAPPNTSKFASSQSKKPPKLAKLACSNWGSGAAGIGQSREERRLDVAICFGTLSQGHEFLLR